MLLPLSLLITISAEAICCHALLTKTNRQQKKIKLLQPVIVIFSPKLWPRDFLRRSLTQVNEMLKQCRKEKRKKKNREQITFNKDKGVEKGYYNNRSPFSVREQATPTFRNNGKAAIQWRSVWMVEKKLLEICTALSLTGNRDWERKSCENESRVYNHTGIWQPEQRQLIKWQHATMNVARLSGKMQTHRDT